MAPREMRERGFAAHERGDLAQARRIYSAVLAESPADFEVLHALGILEVQSGRFGAAVEILAPVVPHRAGAGAHSDLGNAFLGASRLGEALASYERAIALQPDFTAALVNRGHALRGLGRREEALASYARAAEVSPGVAEAHLSRATLLLELGRWAPALRSAETVLALGMDCAEVHTVCGVALAGLARPDEAERCYEQALARDARYVPALINQGILLKNSNRFEAALTRYDRALALEPANFEALCNRAAVLIELERFAAALADCSAAAAVRADRPELHLHRARSLAGLGRHEAALEAYDAGLMAGADPARAQQGRATELKDLGRPLEAVDAFDRALSMSPGEVRSHLGRARALAASERFEAAVAGFTRAIALDPYCRDAFVGRAAALRRLNRLHEALADCDRTIELKADAGAHCNRGSMLTEMNQCEAACAAFAQALAIDPGHAAGHFNRSIALLLSGRLAEAWPDYEWRWQIEEHGAARERRQFSQPRWSGGELPEDSSLLVHSEQGLGDTLQFCRYARVLAASGARVILEVQPPLESLLAGLEGAAAVVAQGQSLPSFDYWCPLMSVPLACGTTLETIPTAHRYLDSPPDKVARWETLLSRGELGRPEPGRRRRPLVGLAWSGSAQHKHDHNRSLALAELLEPLPRGVQYVSLQKELRAADRGTLARHGDVLDASAQLADFSDTAALCDCLDLIISVDTSVAHLAGALGRPTWILLPWYPDWRWQLQRDDSPWYPSVTLYRQTRPGAWRELIARVAADLERRFDGRGEAGRD